MSFSSTDSFEVDLLLDSDDEEMDMNPFWSSDEGDDEEKQDKNKDSGIDMKITDNPVSEQKKGNRDSGIVLSETKENESKLSSTGIEKLDDIKKEIENINNIEKNRINDIKSEKNLNRQLSDGAIEVKNKDTDAGRTRNHSEGATKPENKLYYVKDKHGNVVKEDDMSREYGRQKSESNALPSLMAFWTKKKTPLSKTMSCPNTQKLHWLEALEKAKHMEDPWEKFDIIGTCPTERAKRFRYNALKKKWITDEVLVKMQNESFGKGAMRKCFRMKKLSTMVHSNDWNYASNIVAKRYFDDDVLPKTYFDDIKLQMDAKLWAEEYNKHDPPKKVDIIQVALLKLLDREAQPMFHIEHFVEGKYVKYNSNSGFVLREEETVRATPQAFSHFTFERSGHQMIVVDIQGVGDLYTDPQIHTAKADEYGEANLGTKGMALFFATHECSQICQDMNLEKFDLSEEELKRLTETSSRSSTATEVKHSDLASPGEKMAPMFDLVERLISSSSDDSGMNGEEPDAEPLTSPVIITPTQQFGNHLFPGRQRMYSETDSGVSSEDEISAHDRFFNCHVKKVSCVDPDGCVARMLSSDTIAKRLEALANYEVEQTSILSQVHYDLGTYNYIGRFTDSQPDMGSTLYHLEKAAMSGSLQANKLLALKYSQIATEEFADLEVEENFDNAMDCLIEAATRGDKDSMIRTAKAFDTGINLGTARTISWTEALKWYEAALQQTDTSTNCNFNANPNYEINARMAEIWRQGGNGVEKDPSYAGELFSSAAEEAMNSGKGKLSNKYYMLAEEAWGEVEED